jgi:hypothetical protein
MTYGTGRNWIGVIPPTETRTAAVAHDAARDVTLRAL